MVWKSRHDDGRHFKTGRTLYNYPPTSKKYADIISLKNPTMASASASTMLKEFNDAETRDKKVHIKRAIVQAANRAGVASKNMNLSERERREAKEIQKIYNDAKEKMVLPSKNNSSRMNYKAMSLSDLMKEKEALDKEFLDFKISKRDYDRERRAIDREISKQSLNFKKMETKVTQEELNRLAKEYYLQGLSPDQVRDKLASLPYSRFIPGRAGEMIMEASIVARPKKMEIKKIDFKNGKWQFDEAMEQKANWDQENFDWMVDKTAKSLDVAEKNEFWQQYNSWKRQIQQ